MDVDSNQQSAQVVSGTELAKSVSYDVRNRLLLIKYWPCRKIRADMRDKISSLKAQYPRFQPGLAIIQQGSRPDSVTYVRMKEKAAAEAGIAFTHIILGDGPEVDEMEILAAVQKLNEDEKIHGVLVQLPLSDHIGREGERRITEAVSPTKDVDGCVAVLFCSERFLRDAQLSRIQHWSAFIKSFGSPLPSLHACWCHALARSYWRQLVRQTCCCSWQKRYCRQPRLRYAEKEGCYGYSMPFKDSKPA